MTRLSIYAAVALVIAGLLWNTDRLAKKVGEERYARKAAEGQLILERDNTRKANEAAERHIARADALEADRRDNPLPAVRVCKSASVPKAASGPATAVPGEAAQADNPPADAGDSQSVDIGPALDDFATDAEANLIQCQELVRWLGSR